MSTEPVLSLAGARRTAPPAVVRPVTPGAYESWGRWPRVRHAGVVMPEWSCDPPDLSRLEGPLLAYGLGRSYGDVCLNDGGTLLDTTRMNRVIAFSHDTGRLHCEAGMSLADILALVLPHGWCVPVTPGTCHVTIGGAIANDVHGKNHHQAGTFGCHVLGLELLRSDGQRLWCSPEHNTGLFAATVGGLGLTGLILSAEFQLRRVPGPLVSTQRLRMRDLSEFFALSEASDASCEYTVAWVDGFARGRALGRGVFMRGNHVEQGSVTRQASRTRLNIPFDAPSFLLAPALMRLANQVYYRTAPAHGRAHTEHYTRFMYPLDALGRWNLLYGRRGFLQYQCVVPPDGAAASVRELLARVAAAKGASFLAVLKRFGSIASPGLLSFPRAGITLALDMALRGQATLELCEQLDDVVAAAGGAVYPCKDARMSPTHFERFYPQVNQFERYIDPRFSSSFWRRVRG
jgi:FAD/FMN-containing dehydrogenase